MREGEREKQESAKNHVTQGPVATFPINTPPCKDSTTSKKQCHQLEIKCAYTTGDKFI